MDTEKLVNEYNAKRSILGKKYTIEMIGDKAFYNIRLADEEIVKIPDFVYGIHGIYENREYNINLIKSRIYGYDQQELNDFITLYSRENKNGVVNKIIFGDNIKYIHDLSFTNFENLEYISDFTSLEYFSGNFLFYRCKKLKTKPKIADNKEFECL